MSSEDISKAREIYQAAFNQHGVSMKTVKWGSNHSQQSRFGVLAEIADLSGKSILDVGCGFADLYDYLKTRYQGMAYTGLELVADMAAQAQKRQPDCEILIGDIDSLEPDRKWDYVMLSGVLNISCYDYASAEHLVRRMFSHALQGVAINFLSRYSTGSLSLESAYYDPADFVNLAAQLTRRFTLQHNYRDNDFTLYLLKAEGSSGTEQRPGAIPSEQIRRP